jgi:hypothetical protein
MTVLSCLVSMPAWSSDARSIALGGSTVANGYGVHGVMENPASLMAMKRRKEKFHFLVGVAAELRDTGSAIDTLTDDKNQGLIDDIGTEIDILSNKQTQCDPISGNGSDTCVDGTQAVADVSAQLLEILNVVDDETLDGQARFDLGMALSQSTYPMAVNVLISATGTGKPNIAAGDRAYIEEFQDLLGDDLLTLDEVRGSSFMQVSALGVPLGVQQPEDVLRSEAQGGLLVRTQLGLSFATTVKVGKVLLDAGITPKFSSLKARNLVVRVQEEFNDATASIEDRFNDSEVTESSFTFDAGASLALTRFPLRVAAVLRNVVPESISTTDGFDFDTTPQLVLGGLFQQGLISVNADIALNEGKVDNFETQKMGIGVEYGTTRFAIRGGISHDVARPADSTALSLGFGLGPLQVGARLTGLQSLEAGAQLSYSFK